MWTPTDVNTAPDRIIFNAASGSPRTDVNTAPDRIIFNAASGSPRRGEMTSAEYRDVLGGAKRIIVSQLADSGSVQIGFRWRSVPVTQLLLLAGPEHGRTIPLADMRVA